MAPRLAGRIYARRMTRKDGWMFGPWSIFVAPWGSDATGDGTWLNPYFSPGKAATIMHDTTGGYTAFCRGGTYGLTAQAEVTLHVGVNATAAAPLVFREFPGERPKLTYGAAVGVEGMKLKQSIFVTIRGLEVLLTGAIKGFVLSETCDCLVEACEVWCNTGDSSCGINIASNPDISGLATDRNTVRGCHLHDLQGEGVYVKRYLDNADSVDGNVIEGNLYTGSFTGEAIQSTTGTDGYPCPTNTVIRNNIVRCAATDRGAMSVVYDGTIIENNIVIGSGGAHGLSGSVTAHSTIPSIIRNNLVVWGVNTGDSAGGISITGGDAAATVSIYHNTIANFANAGAGNGFGVLAQSLAGTYNFKNNIVAGTDYKQISFFSTAGAVMDYNNVYGTTNPAGTNLQTGDPAFAETTEYRLSAGSPGLASGLGGLVAYDLNRRPRDATHPTMGCHEYP